MMANGKAVQVIDVRPRAAFARNQDLTEGIPWRDPEQFQQWVGELSKSEPVVVYCSYGFHVGCKTAIKLREAGFDAKYMNSGHSGWKAIGAAMKIQA
jgi:Fe-Mn family superoxide dismutase